MSVSTQPGQIAFTCMFCGASSAAKRAHEAEQAGLRGAVAACSRARRCAPGSTRRRRCGVRPAPSARCAQRGADAVVGAGEVRLHDVVEAVVRAVVVRAADPADGDERVDRPLIGRQGGDDVVDLRPVADVARAAAAHRVRRRRVEPLEARGRAGSASRRRTRAGPAIALPIPTPPPVTTTCRPRNRSIVRFSVCTQRRSLREFSLAVRWTGGTARSIDFRLPPSRPLDTRRPRRSFLERMNQRANRSA